MTIVSVGNMGNLTPGAHYIYENVDGVIYAKKRGENTRIEIGRLYKAHERDREELWNKILRASKYNSALQQAVENIIILYYLGINDGT